MPTTRPFDYRTDPPRRLCAGSGRFPEYRVGTSGSCPVCRHQMNLGSDYFTTRVPEHVVLIDLRPNANPILDAMRDDDLGGDPWGTAMAWGFAVCEVLAYYGEYESIRSEMGYRPSIAGALAGYDGGDPAAWEGDFPDVEVLQMLHGEGVTIDDLAFAARCLSRYIDWLRAAGRDY